MPHRVFSLNRAIRLTSILFFSLISCRNWKKFWTKRSSWAVVRKNHLKPRPVRLADEDSALSKSILFRSAVWLAVAVTLLLYDPRRATTFSWVIRRSASVPPTCGLLWWSAKTSWIFAPLRFGRPPPLANGRLGISFAPLLIISAANSTAFFSSAPVEAAAPVSG